MRKSKVGRPPKLSDLQMENVLAWNRTHRTIQQVARENGVSPTTIRNALRRFGEYKHYQPERFIYTLLATITTHVTPQEAKILNASQYNRGEYGWLIYIGVKGEPPVPELREPSAGFKGVVARARSLGCSYILFDRDAAALPGVVTYDW